jgi:hypothetical protein
VVWLITHLWFSLSVPEVTNDCGIFVVLKNPIPLLISDIEGLEMKMSS